MIYTDLKNIEPLHDFVLVERITVEETPSGIVVPTREEQNLAKVISVGPGREGVPGSKPELKRGDYVLLAKFIGTKIVVDNKDYHLIKWYDCQAKITLPK
jgi:chaperonin GroES